MKLTDSSVLLEKYSAFFIDAYGVLVTSQGALPGAEKFIQSLRKRDHAYYILTNDASRLPETAAAFYASAGIEIPLPQILTAGSAIQETFRRRGWSDVDCAVLGTKDTHEYVRRAGGRSIEITESAEFDALVIGDDSGFDVLPTLSALITSLHRQLRAGRRPALLVANSDLLYPRAPNSFGVASGSLARLIEIALEQLHPDLDLKFEVLGKPAALLYEMALSLAGLSTAEKAQAVMLGDQLHTDVRGANAVGISSALLLTGITREIPAPTLSPEQRPTYVLRGL